MKNQSTSAREPARDVEVFAQTINTMQSQEASDISALPWSQERELVLSKPAASLLDAADDQDGSVESFDDQQGNRHSH